MAEFLVLEDAQTFAQPLPAGQIIDDAVFDVVSLELAGVPLLAYNPATMEAPLTAFLGLAEPRTPGMLLALLVAAGAIGGGGGGSGDVNGPAGSTDNAIARFNGLTGKLLQNSLVTITDLGSIALPAGQTVDGRDVSADGTLLDATAAALTAHIGSGGAAHAAATTSDAGFMSAADKTAHNAVVAEAIRDGDFAGSYAADLTRTGAGAYAGLKSNLAAIVAPTVTDDSAADYAVGSRWIDVVADRTWVCVDATVGAALWMEVGGGMPLPFYAQRRVAGDYDPIVGLPLADPLAILAGSAGLGRVALWPCLQTFTPSSIGIYCTTALGGGSQIEIVIYAVDPTTGGTGVLVWSSGALTVVTNTRASSSVGMPTFVKGRVYWVGVIFNDGSSVRAIPTGSLYAIRGIGTAPSGATRGSVANAFGLTVGTPPNPFVIGSIGFGATAPAVEALI